MLDIGRVLADHCGGLVNRITDGDVAKPYLSDNECTPILHIVPDDRLPSTKRNVWSNYHVKAWAKKDYLGKSISRFIFYLGKPSLLFDMLNLIILLISYPIVECPIICNANVNIMTPEGAPVMTDIIFFACDSFSFLLFLAQMAGKNQPPLFIRNFLRASW